MTTIAAVEHDLSLRIPSLISLWRGTKNTGNLTSRELKAAGDALFSLQRGLTGDRTLAGADYMEDNGLLGAYLLYYWPVSYMQTALAASTCQFFCTLHSRKTIRILDIGSGPGPASCAVMDLLQRKYSDGISFEFTLADASGKALSLAEKLLKQKTSSEKTVKVFTHEVDLEHSLHFLQEKDTYDIIIVSHALNELWRGDRDCIAKRYAMLEKVAERLSAEGFLFLLEPALLETSRSLMAVRDLLVSHGFSIYAPCLSDGLCPALSAGPNHTCHAEIPWTPPEPVSSLAKTAGLDRNSVKMSFIAAGKKPQNNDASAEEKRSGRTVTARVVSDAMLNKSGRIRYLLCNGHTRFAFSAKKGDTDAQSAGFFALRRYDVIEIISPEIRGEGENTAYGFGPDTKLTVVSRI
ncbi:MAG: small ribosomal subunit Rsm22 family protein [Treponema sp.]|nr:small ribosomal subunit Rsm22 family protein [Treponema sp.]